MAPPILGKVHLGFAVLFLLVFVLELSDPDGRPAWRVFSRLGMMIFFLGFAYLSYQRRRR